MRWFQKVCTSLIFDLFLYPKHSQLYQTSLDTGIKEVDANYGYFHAYVKGVINWNVILTFFAGNVWVEKVKGVWGEVIRFVTNHFLEMSLKRLALDEVGFRTISPEVQIGLTSLFLLWEFDLVVTQIKGNKSLDLYGFNFTLLERF